MSVLDFKYMLFSTNTKRPVWKRTIRSSSQKNSPFLNVMLNIPLTRKLTEVKRVWDAFADVALIHKLQTKILLKLKSDYCQNLLRKFSSKSELNNFWPLES